MPVLLYYVDTGIFISKVKMTNTFTPPTTFSSLKAGDSFDDFRTIWKKKDLLHAVCLLDCKLFEEGDEASFKANHLVKALATK
jgi:hypothetical protein